MRTKKIEILFILFFGLYMVLPSYLAIELSSKLPLITASRAILVLMLAMYLLCKRGRVNLIFTKDVKLRRSFYIYFFLLIAVNLSYVKSTGDAIKELLTLVFEELLVVFIVVWFVDSREKFLYALKIIVYSSAIVAVIASFSSVTGINLFALLNTVERTMLISNYERLGFVRAEAGFGHPVYYGLFAAMMIPICMYFVEYSKKRWLYLICMSLNMIGLLLSNSRGSMAAFAMVFLYMLVSKDKKSLLKYKNFCIFAVLGVISALLISSRIRDLVWGIVKSMLAIVIPDVSVGDNYGVNASGMVSRMRQFTSLKWTWEHNALFGMGASAQNRGVISILDSNGVWGPTNTFDSVIVSVFCQFGIIGSIGYMFLYGSIVKKVFASKYKKDEIMQMFKYVFITFFIGLLTVSNIHDVFWVITALMISYINIRRAEVTT